MPPVAALLRAPLAPCCDSPHAAAKSPTTVVPTINDERMRGRLSPKATRANTP
jgi:hypothetical protein